MHKSICISILLMLSWGAVCLGQQLGNPMAEEANIYQQVADVDLTIDGSQRRLSDIYHQSPVIIAQVFARCTGICSPSLLQLKKNLEAMKPEQRYTVLVISFDPRDTGAELRHFAQMLGVDQQPHWLFATTKQIDALNASLGFHAYWDPSRQQYEHDALLSGINRQGIIKKKLIGLRDERALSEMIREINDGFIASYALPDKNRIFSCFHYNSATGQNQFGAGFLVMLVPGLMTVALIGLLSLRAGRQG